MTSINAKRPLHLRHILNDGAWVLISVHQKNKAADELEIECHAFFSVQWDALFSDRLAMNVVCHSFIRLDLMKN